MAGALSPTELLEATGKERPSAQGRALNFMGITFKPRPDGTILVDRDHYNMVMGVTVKQSNKASNEPNWDALNG